METKGKNVLLKNMKPATRQRMDKIAAKNFLEAQERMSKKFGHTVKGAMLGSLNDSS